MTESQAQAEKPGIDPAAFSDAMAHVPTSVAVVTASSDDGTIAMVVGSFAYVSLEPPLISFMPAKTSGSFARLQQVENFTVNVLAHDQEDLCRRIAQAAGDKLSGIEWLPSPNGSPVLAGVVASIDCRIDQIIDAGDHYVVLASVQNLGVHRPVAPLIFFQRGYGGFTPGAFMAPSDRELAHNVGLVQSARPALERLVSDLGVEATVFARIGDHAVAVATVPEGGENHTVLGSRFPLMAPLGDLFVAWESDASVEGWLQKLRYATLETREQLRRRLEVTREQGWAYTLRSEMRDLELVEVLRNYGVDNVTPALQRKMEDAVRRALPNYRSVDLGAVSSVSVGNMVAPVRDSSGRVQMIIRVTGFQEPLSSSELERFAGRLTAAAQEASELIYKAAELPRTNGVLKRASDADCSALELRKD